VSRGRLLIILLATAILVVSGCSTSKPATEAPKTAAGNTLVLRGRNDIQNMDVPFHTGHEDGMVYPLIYSRLVYVLPDAPSTLLPDLATKWVVTPDGKEYTFTLRQDAKWHKGFGNVTAKDVVWSFNRIRDPKVGTGFSGEWVGVKDVVAVDDFTVKITMSKADPTFPVTVLNRSGFVECQKAVETKGKAYTSDPVGSGPYIFESWTPGDKVTLVKNTGHWLLKGNIDRIIARGIVDDSVAELAIKAGNLDVAYIATPEVQRSIIDKKTATTIVKPAGRSVFMSMTWKKNRATSDPRFRLALAIAIDRDLLVKKFMDGLGAPAHSILNPECYGYDGTENFKYDPEKAKTLIKQVGLPANFKLDFITRTDTGDMATAIQSMWTAVGIKTELTVLESPIMFERRDRAEFDVMLYSMSRDFPEGFLPLITVAGGPKSNTALYTGVEDLAKELGNQMDLAARAKIWVQIQKKLATDIPVIPVVYPVNMVAMRADVQPFPITLWRYPVWMMKVGK